MFLHYPKIYKLPIFFYSSYKIYFKVSLRLKLFNLYYKNYSDYVKSYPNYVKVTKLHLRTWFHSHGLLNVFLKKLNCKKTENFCVSFPVEGNVPF